LSYDFSDKSILDEASHNLLCPIESKERRYDWNREPYNSEPDNQSDHISREEHADEESEEHHQCYDDKELYYEEEIFVHGIL
jgi:hypothetical protein